MNKGFSLVELLSVLLILSLLCLTVMSFQQATVRKIHKQDILSQFSQSLLFARNEAQLRGEALILRASHGDDWSKGYVLIDKKNRLIHQWQAIRGGWAISWSGFYSKKDIIISNSLQTSAMNGYFLLTHQQQSVPVKLVLNRLGRLRIE